MAAGSDIAVVALPVRSIVDAARDLAAHLSPDALITDTGSTKASIVSSLDSFWPCFVGSHPIAGKENPGYQARQANLFAGRACIVTPGPSARGDCLERAVRFWEDCGANVTVMDPVKHDELMAVISHMPHLLSFASMGLAADFQQVLDSLPPDYVPPASGIESRFDWITRQAGLGRFRRQVDLGDEESWSGRVDFVAEHRPLVVEVQSEAHHSSLTDVDADARRHERLRAGGFVVVEVWDTEVWHRADVVIARIAAALRRLDAAA